VRPRGCAPGPIVLAGESNPAGRIERMSRFRLSLEYVGTRYSGWQIQKNARTVQGELDTAVRKVSGLREFEIYGSGRTDAGVHALQQVAHLDLKTTLSPDALRHALNDELPSDINILQAGRVPHRFHARHSAVGRSYLYQVSRRRTAFGKPFVWWVKDSLDAERMRLAAGLFRGLKDFRSFTAGDPEAASTKVKVEAIEIAEAGDLILIRVVGSHFLWKMVRRMVGVLVEVGRGALAPGEVAHFLGDESPRPAELTAPPSGLFLERVFYEGDSQEYPLQPVLSLGRGDGGTRPPGAR
jgi:tRNA pseudouridine38-40 synthase